MKIYTNKQLNEQSINDFRDVVKRMTDLKNMSSDKISVNNTEKFKKRDSIQKCTNFVS